MSYVVSTSAISYVVHVDNQSDSGSLGYISDAKHTSRTKHGDKQTDA